MLGFSNSLWLLFLSRIIDGLSGANISTAQAAITDSTNEKTRTQGLGLVGAAFGVGFVLGPIIAFIVLAASGQNYQLVAFTAAFFYPATTNQESRHADIGQIGLCRSIGLRTLSGHQAEP